MEERTKEVSFFKSNDPEKLEVFEASSLQNEIRFYLNETQYFTASVCGEGCLVKLAEERAKTGNKNSAIKKNLKDYLKLLLIVIESTILAIACTYNLAKIEDNLIIIMIVINIMYFIINIINAFIIENMRTTPEIKSKHSAEHMMVNFLESNKRLPKSIEEVKTASRFSRKCGSRKRIEWVAEEFVRGMVATIIVGIASIILSHFSSNITLNTIGLLAIYLITGFAIGEFIKGYNALDFVIYPIKKVLINIIQCANTTSKVKDIDILLAYCAARSWLRLVYPEFYNENEEFLK